MAKIEEIELEKTNDEISELAELEQLIISGAETLMPYIVDYPVYDKETETINYKKMAIKLKPLSSTEWNNATGNQFRNKETTVNIVKKSLHTKNEEKFPPRLVEQMPNGVINVLFTEVARISGVKFNSEENKQLIKDIMGF